MVWKAKGLSRHGRKSTLQTESQAIISEWILSLALSDREVCAFLPHRLLGNQGWRSPSSQNLAASEGMEMAPGRAEASRRQDEL